MGLTEYERAAEILGNAEAVLIGAGAGLSAAAGLDYTDETAFSEKFPAMLQYGVRNQYQLMGYPFQDEALKWGYLAANLDYVYRTGPSQVYRDLFDIVEQRNYFVMTSNVDRFFHKNGFAEDRIYTPQGDYAFLQCLTPCHQGVWDAKPVVARMIPHIDPATQKVTDCSTLPTCPNCGEAVYMNVRAGHWFVEEPYLSQADALNHWLNTTRSAPLAVLEIGAGFNTPGVIRAPMEAIGTRWSNANFIRINREHTESPEGTISITTPADIALRMLIENCTPPIG